MSSYSNRERAKHWAKRLECPVDENADYKNTFWVNRDLIPIPDERRTWTWQGFAGYWVITGRCSVQNSMAALPSDSFGGVNTTAWTIGSSLLALGLSVGQAMGVVVGVSLLTAIIAVSAGWMGSHQYLGFTVLSRA